MQKPTNETIDTKRLKSTKSGLKNKLLCNWFGCEKEFSHFKCFQSHQNKHLIDKKGQKFSQKIVNFLLEFYSFDGIEDYVEIIEENDCNYSTFWSYELSKHIPFLCHFFAIGLTATQSQDIFAHRVSHFGSEKKSETN